MSQSTSNIGFNRLLLIVLFVIIGAVIGLGGSFLNPHKGRIEAQISSPKAMDLGNYFSLFTTYQLVSGEEQSMESAVLENIFSEFNRTLSSTDLAAQYLVQQDIVKSLSQVKNQSPQAVAQQLAQQFKVNTANSVTTITFEKPLENLELSRQLVNGIIISANNKTKEELYADLVYKWKTLFQQIKNAAENNLGAIQQNGQLVQQDWNGKLRLMTSVQPLDNNFIAYRYVKDPIVVQETFSRHLLWGLFGAAAGAVLGLLISLGMIRRKAS